MRSVKIKKQDLLEQVKHNREKHRDIFLKAQEGYRKKFIEVVEERLEQARNGKRFSQHIELVEPVDMTQEYDRVIAMLTLSVDDEIELDAQSFAAYVQDDWSWKRQFIASNATYTDAL